MADDFDDIGADVALAFGTDPAPAPEPAESILPPDTQADPVETEEQKAERARDEQGRFAKAAEPVQDAASQVQEPDKTILNPPRSWTAAAKAEWAAASPLMKQEILRREGEIDQGKAQWDTKAEQFNKLDAVLAPVKDRLTLSGLTPDTYVRALVQADEMLRGPQKLQAIHMLAQQYGINLGQPMAQGGPQTQPFQGQPDPQYQALQQQFAQLQARLDADTQAKADAEKQATQATIDAFASDPANLYFDNVKPEMAALLQAGSAKDLKSAYEMACNARPDIRALLAAAAAAKPAHLTKPAGLSVTGAQKGAASPTSKPLSTGSEEDDVRAAIQELSGAV